MFQYCRAQNLRQGIIMKTSFKTRGLRMVRQFCGCQYFNYEIFVSSYSPFFSNLSNQNLQNVKTPKRNSRVSLNDTLLNFGLRCTCTQLCYMTFWALEHLSCFVGLPVPVTFYVMYIKPVFS